MSANQQRGSRNSTAAKIAREPAFVVGYLDVIVGDWSHLDSLERSDQFSYEAGRYFAVALKMSDRPFIKWAPKTRIDKRGNQVVTVPKTINEAIYAMAKDHGPRYLMGTFR